MENKFIVANPNGTVLVRCNTKDEARKAIQEHYEGAKSAYNLLGLDCTENMNFKCPKCQGNRIEEDGFPDRYQCLNCGWVLPVTEITTPSTEELYEWLKENNML
jgi:hypothetical protein